MPKNCLSSGGEDPHPRIDLVCLRIKDVSKKVTIPKNLLSIGGMGPHTAYSWAWTLNTATKYILTSAWI